MTGICIGCPKKFIGSRVKKNREHQIAWRPPWDRGQHQVSITTFISSSPSLSSLHELNEWPLLLLNDWNIISVMKYLLCSSLLHHNYASHAHTIVQYLN